MTYDELFQLKGLEKVVQDVLHFLVELAGRTPVYLRHLHALFENRRRGLAIDLTTTLDLRQHRSGNGKEIEQLLIPLQGLDIEKHRT